jgi:RNA polymerase sigma-70 factor (ECF subfamily)
VESDSQLVSRAQSGDGQAFEELVRRFSALVFRLAVSILGREFIPEAEDVAQEVFLKVHHAIGSFRGEAEFSSWIYRITFNQAVNLKARVRFRSPHANETVLYHAMSPEPGPYRQAETTQRDQALAEYIQTPYGCTIGWAPAWAKWRNCLACPRTLPNRTCIVRASFCTAC